MKQQVQKNPQLRFSEFNDEWNDEKLGMNATFLKGKGISKSDIVEDGKNSCIRYGELYTEYNEVITKDKIVSKTNVEIKKSKLSIENDVLIPSSGETHLDIATASCIKVSGVILGGDLNVIRSNYNGVFLAYYLNSNKKKQIAQLAQGNSVVHLYNKNLSSLSLNIPSEQEQQKIASFLQQVDQKIDLLSQKITALETYKKGLMQKLFSQEIRFKQDDGSDFSDWEEKQLGKIFLDRKGKGISKSKITNDGIHDCILYGELYTRYNEVITEVHSKTNTNEGIPSKIGDLLIPSSTTTTGIDLANVTALNKPEVRLGGDIIILRSKKAINNIFYSYYLSNYKKKAIASRAQGITIVHLYFSGIKDLFIHYPCLEEQTKLANFLIAIDDKINQTQQQLQQTRTFKKGLLQQIFV